MAHTYGHVAFCLPWVMNATLPILQIKTENIQSLKVRGQLLDNIDLTIPKLNFMAILAFSLCLVKFWKNIFPLKAHILYLI